MPAGYVIHKQPVCVPWQIGELGWSIPLTEEGSVLPDSLICWGTGETETQVLI
jgi:hypothetical protein